LRRLSTALVVLGVTLALFPASAGAQAAGTTTPPVDVFEVSGLIDAPVADGIEHAISRAETGDSAQNRVRAPIESIVPVGNRRRVRIGPLTAEITAVSAERLRLKERDVVVAEFKATATRLTPLS